MKEQDDLKVCVAYFYKSEDLFIAGPLFSFQFAVEREAYHCHLIIQHLFRHFYKIHTGMITP